MFNVLMTRATLEAIRVNPGMRRVVELGNQTWRGDRVAPGIETTKQFFEANGFDHYMALDVNDRMNAVPLDLNEVQPSHVIGPYGKFDLVTNNGTGEHVFNQAAVFENIHNLCKHGGLMLQVLPMSGWPNHGFYQYSPIVFNALAEANGYAWRFIWIGENKGNYVQINFEDNEWLFKEGKPTKLEELIMGGPWKGRRLSIVTCYQKVLNDPFKIPMQGKYVSAIESEEIRRHY